ncbi:DNA internalization-related competence protein ComEC/Rec2 [Peptoniphilus mikwangii]|uniref:DNA internalization-related competence protein ComEC/Rec2 n=1 Tax=Peptoniphilus mikwangii TaxID=1354300 RepID=UPI0005608496|nr:DNA internalization-related competence protein ComEC/Rec2 [Peptoniphilus mikwangii]
MIYLLLSMILGIVLGDCLKINLIYLAILVMLSSTYFFYFKKFKTGISFLCIILFIISFLNVSMRTSNQLNESVNIKAEIVDDYINNESKYIASSSIFKKYLLYSKEKLSIGDIVIIYGSSAIPEGKMNFSDFNYKNYLKSKGIYEIIYSNSVKKVGESKSLKLRTYFKDYITDTVSKNLSDKNADIINSILLGNSNYIDKDIKDNFRNIGLSHMLAISGLHMGILMIIFEGILKLFGISKVLRRSIALLFSFVYLYLISMPIGAFRAYLMFGFMFMSFLFKYKYTSFNALILSAMITILINPFSIYSPSFLLSYLSVLGIILFYKKFEILFQKNYFGKSLALTLSVNIMLFPVSIYLFREFSVLGFISNVFLLPLYSFAIILSYILIIFKPIAFLIAPSINFILNVASFLAVKINDFSFLNLEFAEISIISVFILYSNFIIIKYKDIFINFYKFNISVLISLILIILINSAMFLYDYNNSFELNFIYVGQGDCAIGRTNNRYFMVDTGGSSNENYNPGKKYTLNYLKAKGINKIDKVFISHFDEDHVDGLLDIIDEVKIKSLYISYIEDNKYLQKALSKGMNIYLVQKDDLIKMDDNTFFRIISDVDEYNSSNDKSMVMILNHRGFKILFTGDIEQTESNITETCNLLKVAHHGSKTSTSEEFLKTAKPRYAVISCGINNSYRHPHSEVINRLQENNVITKVTNEVGEINLNIKKNSIIFKGFKEKDGSFGIITLLTYIVIIAFVREYGEYIAIQGNIQKRY